MEHLLRDREQEDKGNLLTRLGQNLAEIGMAGLSHVVPFVANGLRELPTFKDVPGVALKIEQPGMPAELQTGKDQIANESLEILNRTRNSLAAWSTTYNNPIKLQKTKATKPTTSRNKTIESKLFFQEKWEQHHLEEVRGLDDIFPAQVSGFFNDAEEVSIGKRSARESRKQFDKTLVAAGHKKIEREAGSEDKVVRPFETNKENSSNKGDDASKKDFSHYPKTFASNVLKKVPDTFPRKPELMMAATEDPAVKEVEVQAEIETPSLDDTAPVLSVNEVIETAPETETVETATLETIETVTEQQAVTETETIEVTEAEPAVQKFETDKLEKVERSEVVMTKVAPKKQPEPDAELEDDLSTLSMILRNNRRVARSIAELTESYFAQAAQEEDGDLYI